MLCWTLFAAMVAGSCAAQIAPQAAPAGSGTSVKLPAEISDALKNEASALSPSVTVAWTEDFQPPLTPKEYADATGNKQFDQTKTFTRQEKMNLTWQSDGHYFLAFHQFFLPSGTDKPIPRFNVRHSFDGTLFYQHGANPGEAHSVIRSDFQDFGAAVAGEYINMDYFQSMGFPLPVTGEELQKLKPLRASILQLIDANDTRLAAVEPVTIDGQNLTRVKIKRGPHSPLIDGDPEDADSHEGEEDFYLDPARAYAQVRLEEFDRAGKLQFRTDCSDFREFRNKGLFLPRTIAAAQFDPAAKQTLTVTHMDFNAVPADKFVLSDTQTGTWFIDHLGMKEVTHILQKDGSLKLKKTAAN